MNAALPTHVVRHVAQLQKLLKSLLNKPDRLSRLNTRRCLQSSLSILQRQSFNLLRKEKEIRLMRLKLDKFRRDGTRILWRFQKSSVNDSHEEPINVVDVDNPDVGISQDDLDGEEQLEKIDYESKFDSGIDLCSFDRSVYTESRPNNISLSGDSNLNPIDLSVSNQALPETKFSTPPKPSKDFLFAGSHFKLESNSIPMATSTPIINNLPTRRATDDHLEQFMRVDPNQNIKWKQLAEKYNKELGPNVCGVCHKTLSCKSALTMHYRVHTEERPFVCGVCEKRFSTKGNLKTHLGQHADVTDHYSLGSSIVSSQFKPGSIVMPPSNVHSQSILNIPSKLSLAPSLSFANAFPPAFQSNPFSAESHLFESLKVSQKLSVPDINSNCIVRADDLPAGIPCPICPMKFPNKHLIEIHIRSHSLPKDLPYSFHHPIKSMRDKTQTSQMNKPTDGKRDLDDIDPNSLSDGSKKNPDYMSGSPDNFSMLNCQMPNIFPSFFPFLHRTFPMNSFLPSHFTASSGLNNISRFSMPSIGNGFGFPGLPQNEPNKQ